MTNVIMAPNVSSSLAGAERRGAGREGKVEERGQEGGWAGGGWGVCASRLEREGRGRTLWASREGLALGQHIFAAASVGCGREAFGDG